MDSSIRSSENEFRSQVISWLNAAINRGGYPFELASADPSLATTQGTRFPDIEIWINREAHEGFCGWELKQPTIAVDDKEMIKNAIEKAAHMRACYFVTWNMRDAVIWEVTDAPAKKAQRIFSYPPLQIHSAEDLKIPTQRIALEERAQAILDDLAHLCRDGHLTYIGADDWFFIHRLISTTRAIHSFFKTRLVDMCAQDSEFRNRLDVWAITQGFPIGEREEFFQKISRQIVYQLLGRLLFLQVLRKFRSDIAPLLLDGLLERHANKAIREKFAEIRAIDYQAIFDEDLPDEIPVPKEALPTLSAMLNDFSRRDFGNLPQEVLGNVFENLIPPEERHRLGQYFTREDLADFITAFCVRGKDAFVLDPTCGTGTFLIRAYNRLKWDMGVRDHQWLLSHIWGADIAPFPAELAAINLYRQDISNIGNFPRILKKDFFLIREGQEYEFPPNKPFADDPARKIKEPLPQFDAIIGNPPYIRQEQIDRVVQHYTARVISPALAKDRLLLTPPPDQIKMGEQIDPIEISGQADVYAAMFVHAAALLKEGGRLGFITSNSWLGAEYGKELQEFFLRHFKIVAIVESRVEPWFETAQVNTVFTIVERCEDAKARNNHLVKFVSVKKKLGDLIPWDMSTQAMDRWHGLGRMIAKIESTGNEFLAIGPDGVVQVDAPQLVNDFEDDNFRIRAIPQSAFAAAIPQMFGPGHWGRFLRAPAVYFDLRKTLAEKLVSLADKSFSEVNYGLKPGITEFFTITDERIKEFGIEQEFLKPFLTSFREVERPIIDPDDAPYKLFFCPYEKNELRRLGKKGALKYIAWGEAQRTTGKGAVGRAGVPWPDVPSVKNRPRWYDVGDHAPGDVIINQFVGERIFFPLNRKGVFVSNTFFEARFCDEKLRDVWVALMNSAIAYLIAEVHGRLTWSAGVLYLYGPEIQTLLLPDARKIAPEHQEKILAAFAPILKRKIKKVSEEVKQKDRRVFDAAVLDALGIDPKKYLDAIYNGLADLIDTRVRLGKMQTIQKKVGKVKDTAKIKEEVVAEIIPDGLKPFPESFLPPRAKTREVAVPTGRLRLGAYFMGEQEIINERGERYKASGLDEAEFIISAQKPHSHIVPVPQSAIDLKKALQKRRIYIKGIKQQFMRAFAARTGDERLAERLTAEVMEELGVFV